MKKGICLFAFLASLFIAFIYVMSMQSENETDIRGRSLAHKTDIRKLDKRLAVEKLAYQKERNKEYEEAINLFRKAVDMAGENAASTPARLSLARIYEAVGNYEEAIKEMRWFLKQDQTEQGRAETVVAINRLEKKVAY